MTTPRLRLVQHLGHAVAHSSRTTPGWLEDCEGELIKALFELYDLRNLPRPEADTVRRLVAGEGV